MLSSQQDPKSPYLELMPDWLELDYFRRPRRLRGRRKWFTAIAFCTATVMAIWSFLLTNHWVHQAGPVSTAHTMFSHSCEKCHVETFQPVARLWRGDAIRSVPDSACLACHDGPIHHEQQVYTDNCVTCHREHRGHPALARVGDGHCTACHGALRRKDDQPSVLKNVAGFNRGHPEFRAAAAGATDNASVLFNHQSHLGLDLDLLRSKGAPGLDGLGDRLECGACHQPDAERRYILPIKYEQHCGRCHPLSVQVAGQFREPETRKAAEAFAMKPAPHKEPSVVRATLRERLLEFVKQNPAVLGTSEESEEPRSVQRELTQTATEMEWLWVKRQLERTEDLLFVNRQLPVAERVLFQGAGGCRHCHLEATNRTETQDGLPVYKTTRIPSRWFSRSIFRHDSHRMLTCVACHDKALTSKLTSDVLMPGIKTCHQCHNQQGGARNDCVECHTYHDRSKERSFDGALLIEEAAPRR